MPRKFTRKIEDFVCENCGHFVTGNGFTNHCPECLWSKHVDINPGDRLNDCKGLMEPVGFEIRNGKENLLFRCTKCGFTGRNKVASQDNRAQIIQLSKAIANKAVR